MGWLNRLLGKEDLTAFKDAEEAINTAMRLSHFGSLKSYLNSNGPTDVLDTLDKSTLLHVAARSGNIENVNLLVQHRADVNAQDSNNETPLHVLINNFDEVLGEPFSSLKKFNTLECLKALVPITNCAILSVQGNVLHLACSKRNFNAVCEIVQSHPSILEEKTSKGITPLGLVILNKDVELILYLIKKGANAKCKIPGEDLSIIDLLEFESDSQLNSIYTKYR